MFVFVYTNTCPPATINCGAVITAVYSDVIGHIIGWSSMTSHTYAIDERIPPDTNWTRIEASLPATPPMNSYSNFFENATNQAAYYRVFDLDD
jgi:hypothetical protein